MPAGAAAAALLAAMLVGATAGPLAAQADAPADASLQVGTRTGASAPLVASRLSSPIRVDGRVDEAAWMAIEPLRAVMSSPTFGAEPSERTEFRIAYDEDDLYISGVLHDREPDGIRATSLRRDDGSLSNDWFVVTIDGYRDRENGLIFGVTPAGVRTDLEVPNDAEGRSTSHGMRSGTPRRRARKPAGRRRSASPSPRSRTSPTRPGG
jgi:hypothetical protein